MSNKKTNIVANKILSTSNILFYLLIILSILGVLVGIFIYIEENELILALPYIVIGILSLVPTFFIKALLDGIAEIINILENK